MKKENTDKKIPGSRESDTRCSMSRYSSVQQSFIEQPGGSSDEKDNASSEEREQIEDFGSIVTKSEGYCIHCLTIIGQIEGHYILSSQNKTTKYEHVIPQLVAVEQDERIDGLLILLNTQGGDVEAGLAIAELVAGIRKPTVSLVLGGGHSIGVPLAVAADKSFIARSASMTVHPVRMTGLTLGVPQTFEYFQRMQERINNFVADNSGIDAERYNELAMNTGELVMDVGTILEGEDAVHEGLIDSVGNLTDAIECLHDMIDERRSEEKSGKKSRTKNGKNTRSKSNKGDI